MNINRCKWILLGVVVGLVGIVLAQSLGDAAFRYLTIGEGTAVDPEITFDELIDSKLIWDGSGFTLGTSTARTDSSNMNVKDVQMRSVLPTIGFDDTQSDGSPGAGGFTINMTDVTDASEDSQFIFTIARAGQVATVAAVDSDTTLTGTGLKGMTIYDPNSTTYGMQIRYEGTLGGRLALFGGSPEGWEIQNFVYINPATPPSYLYMESPDGTCARCSIGNTDVWSCTSVTCP